jgi:DNA polymerase delta subunit 1
MDCKGIETVRRDNCALVRDMIDTCLKKILIDRSVENAIAYVKQMISDLLMNRLDISLLIITKQISRAEDKYTAKQAHVELAERMRKRDPATAPCVGDRVPYVVVQGVKGARAFEKSEDPIWVLQNNIPIDVDHYLEHCLSKPLMRIFEAVMPNPQSLLKGDHTLAKVQKTSSIGGLSAFTVKTLKCMSCRTPLAKNEQTVCGYCKLKEGVIYAQTIDSVNKLEQQFAQVWTQCQRCQGSLHQEVLCSSRDCPIFYRRKKVQKDLEDAQELLSRFEW